MSEEPVPQDEADLSLDLVRRIQGGDRGAWNALYARYHDRLLFAIRCRMGPELRCRIQSEDVLQSVVKDAVQDLLQFEPRGPRSLEHYLHVCVLNKIRSKAVYFGADKRAGDRPLSDSMMASLEAKDAEPRYRTEDVYLRLERAMRGLSDDMREVVLLRLVEEVSNKDAATLLGKSEEATSKLFHRALAKLGTTVRVESLP